MNTAGDYINESGLGQGYIVGIDSPSLPVAIDYTGVFWCWNPALDFPEVLYMNAPGFKFQSYQMNNYNTGTVVSGTVQLWILRNYGVTP